MLAPIVLFVYNRPWHTIQTLDALSSNDLANESPLFIFSDGPRINASNDEIEKVDRVREVIRSKLWCHKVNIIESDSNKGLARSIVDGVTQVVNEFGKVIVLEDDIVTSKGFLKFMNEGLELYKDEKRVMDISGYSFPVVDISLPDIFFLEMASSWGWATWSRAWSLFTTDSDWLYSTLIKENKWESFLKIGQENFKAQLINNLEGKIHSWAIKWQAVMSLRSGLSLQPGKSLVRNIGFDSTGTNYTNTDSTFHTSEVVDNLKMFKIPSDEIEENKEILEIYRSFYSNHEHSKKRISNRVILRKIFKLFKTKV